MNCTFDVKHERFLFDPGCEKTAGGRILLWVDESTRPQAEASVEWQRAPEILFVPSCVIEAKMKNGAQ